MRCGRQYGDATKINTGQLPDFDMLVGGFPCQAFSIAGNRRGFNDTRGTLFFEIARILKDKKPKCFILENVKGLLSHDNGNTFKTIITTLTELGYDLQWQVLNSKNFGVPQNRERVFIIGHIRGERRSKIFPIYNKRESITRDVFIDESQWRREGKLREYEGISPTLNTVNGGGHLPLIVHCMQKRSADRPSLRLNPHAGGSGHIQKEDGTTYCVDTANTQAVQLGYKIRRLTPIECERLQGFPDNWTIGSDTQRYKQCGNAVTVNVIEYLIKKMYEEL